MLLLILSITTASAKQSATITNVACSINQSTWSDWYRMDCPCYIDTDAKEIVIFSDINYYGNKFSIDNNGMQDIYYCGESFSQGINTDGYHYKMMEAAAIDKENQRCTIQVLCFTDGDVMLIIEYKDITYKYMLK